MNKLSLNVNFQGNDKLSSTLEKMGLAAEKLQPVGWTRARNPTFKFKKIKPLDFIIAQLNFHTADKINHLNDGFWAKTKIHKPLMINHPQCQIVNCPRCLLV